MNSKEQKIEGKEQSEQSQPQKVIRVKKPKPWQRFLLIFIIILVLAGIVWLARVFSLVSSISQSSSDKTGIFNFPFSQKSGLKGENEGRINLLFFGIGGATHPKGGNLTDSMILVSIDTTSDQKKLAMISIPRDLLVKMPRPLTGEQKINAVYELAQQQKDKTKMDGAQALQSVMREISGQDIHYWVKIDFVGFEKLIDSLGGITVDVLEDIYDSSFPADNLEDYAPFSIKAGERKMNGEVALKYARSRYTTSDFDRSKRQQQIITAVKDEFENKGYIYRPDKILEIMSILSKNLKTNFAPQEISQVYKIIKDIPDDKIYNLVLDNTIDGPFKTVSNGGYYLTPKTGNWKELQEKIKGVFNLSISQKDQAKIEVQDGTKAKIAAKKLTQDLQAIGFDAVHTGAAERIYPVSQIYDFSNGEKQDTINFLQKKLASNKLSTGTLSMLQSKNSPSVHILIIIGEDYVKAENNNE
ncbi:MAG: cell envelope-related transcriptional attenuator [Candidatus Berkelbacteria bacterium Licking1014_7]|uniref:Cell envelope-related transcriptional attenuator n=1 Tax=Candidatus Berkelbacteria bacterium Licking1014_7 TaxID=2017147 RepID=A0A554LIT5_9BACT|nr:MAG: cell envelope-related transcriptional attenuator [Candidatus Berkelbacteria bacterium Licking1014_7]